MKRINLIGLVFILFQYNTLAEEQAKTRCEEAIERIDFACEVEAYRICNEVKDCLTRRDTCVPSSPPSTQLECSTLNTCMQDFKSQFGRYSDAQTPKTACVYEWKNYDDENYCKPSQGIFDGTRQEACPGRFYLSVFSFGKINTYKDDKFNCSAVVATRTKLNRRCEKRIREAKRDCGTLPEKYTHSDYLKPLECPEADRYSESFDQRQYALSGSPFATRGNDRQRGQENKESGASGEEPVRQNAATETR